MFRTLLGAIERVKVEAAQQVVLNIAFEMKHSVWVIAVDLHHPFLVVCQVALQRPVRVVPAPTDAAPHPPRALAKVFRTKPSVVVESQCGKTVMWCVLVHVLCVCVC